MVIVGSLRMIRVASSPFCFRSTPGQPRRTLWEAMGQTTRTLSGDYMGGG
jgi:hypothetical protein